MARERREPTPAETVLAKWAAEHTDGQSILPDFDADFSASFPNLWIFLTWTSVGKLQKEPGSISARIDGTGWKLSYFDPTAKRQCGVVAETLMSGLAKLDHALVDAETVWTRTGKRGKGWTEKKD